MPIKKREPITFDFEYCGQKYKFRNNQILTKVGIFVCNCDIIAYNIEYNENNLRVICIVALDSFYEGMERGKEIVKEEIRRFFGIR